MYLGTKGNRFILNGDHKDLNAEGIYNSLTGPVFGSDVVYDCPNEKLMEQKKVRSFVTALSMLIAQFVKFGLTTEAFESYVPLIVSETEQFLSDSPHFKGSKGVVDLAPAMSELVLFTASGCLQGKEVRA